MLRALGRRTLCLRWLDLRGCAGIEVLLEADPEGVWCGCWRRVSVVVVDAAQAELGRALEGVVRAVRRHGGGGGWLEVLVL